MEKYMLSRIAPSGVIAKNLDSKIFNVKRSYLSNLSKVIELLEADEISVSEVHSSAKETAIKLYPLMRMLSYVPNYAKIKIFRQIMIIVSKERSLLNSKLSIDDNGREINSLVSMYFTPTVFMYMVSYSKYLGFNPILLTSAYFAPILEEVGKFVGQNDFMTNNLYMSYRNSFSKLFLDLYVGWYKYNISDLSLSIKIMYHTYIKLFKDREILSISKIDQYAQDNTFIKDITIAYLSILFPGFIPETLDHIFKLGTIFENFIDE